MATRLATSHSSSNSHFNLDGGAAAEKKKIPVVPLKLTDEDVGSFDGDTIQHLNYEKILKLLGDQRNESLVERHVFVLRKLLKVNKHGFHLKDLPSIAGILEAMYSRIATSTEIEDLICGILEKLSQAYLTEKSSDEVTYRSQAVEATQRISWLLHRGNNRTRQQHLRTYLELYGPARRASAVHKHRVVSQSGLRSMLDDGGVVEPTVELLRADSVNEDETVRALALHLLERMTQERPANCERMLVANGASLLLSDVFDRVQRGGDHLFAVSNVLWNLLESMPQTTAAQLADLRCLAQLKDAFVFQLSQGHSHYERQLRNDLLVLATLLVRADGRVPLVESGLGKLLVLLATHPELKSHNPLLRNLKLTARAEDLELKKLLFNLLVVSSSDPAMLLIMHEQHALLALLEYVRANQAESVGPKLVKYDGSLNQAGSAAGVPLSGDSALMRLWPPAYFEELQLHALACLAVLAPKLLPQYLQLNGNTRVLMLLDWTLSSQAEFAGFGNSKFAAGGRGNKRAQLRNCLRLLRALIATGNEAVSYDLCDQGLIPQLASMLFKFAESKASASDAVDIEIQQDVMYTLAAVCEADVHRKEIFGTSGVDALLLLLGNQWEWLNGHQAMQLVQHVVDTVWSCVVGCATNEDYFVERGGVFQLLDALERVLYDRRHFVSRVGADGQRREQDCEPLVVKQALQLHAFNLPTVNALLCCLIDLCEAVKPLAHVKSWTYTPCNELVVVRSAGAQRSGLFRDDSRDGPPQRSVVHLLCELWRVEEIRLQVHRNPETGAIVDLLSPLTTQQHVQLALLKPRSLTLSIADVHSNLRAKIFSLFCKLGFVDIPANGITTEDNVTLCIIEKYLDFKTAEVWSEVRQEMNSEDIRPTTPDVQALDYVTEISLENARGVANIQQEIMDAQMRIDMHSEQKYYSELRETHNQKQRQIDNFLAFVQRTSKHETLKAAKEKQLQMIEASRSESKYQNTENFHKIDQLNLHTTVLCDRHVQVHSTSKETLLVSKYRGTSLENQMMLQWSRSPPIIEYESDADDDDDADFAVGRTAHDNSDSHGRSLVPLSSAGPDSVPPSNYFSSLSAPANPMHSLRLNTQEDYEPEPDVF